MKTVKKVVIIYLILYIIFSSFSVCFARGYDEACGEYLSNYAREFIAEYCVPQERTVYDNRITVNWGGGEEFTGTFYACCSTGVAYMYKLALGLNIDTEYDFDVGVSSYSITKLQNSPYWDEVNASTIKPGDIVIRHGHVEMYIGNNENANFGNSPHSGKISGGPRLGSDFTHAFRLKSTVDVNPSGKIRGASTSNVNYSKFFFNGVPDGQYSLAKRTFWQVIIDTIGQILDFIVNLVLYIIRAVFVGFTAIAESLLSWMINTVSDTNVEDKSLDMSATETSISDEETKITVDKIFFNKLEIFDINIFDVD